MRPVQKLRSPNDNLIWNSIITLTANHASVSANTALNLNHNPMRDLKTHHCFNLGNFGSSPRRPKVQNTEPVETHLLFTTVAMPHAVLIFISSAAGFALGVLLTMSLRSKRKNIR